MRISVFGFLAASVVTFSVLPVSAETSKILVVKNDKETVVHWDVVDGWAAKQIRAVFAERVRLTADIQTAATAVKKKPVIVTNPKPTPINPWCQCPEGYVVQLLDTIKKQNIIVPKGFLVAKSAPPAVNKDKGLSSLLNKDDASTRGDGTLPLLKQEKIRNLGKGWQKGSGAGGSWSGGGATFSR